MPSSYNYKEPKWVQDTLKADREKKLSSKDRKNLTANREAVSMNLADRAADLKVELQPYNLMSIDQEISQQTDPIIISILKEEKSNIINLLEEAARINKDRDREVKAKAEEQSFLNHIGNLLQNLFTVRK